MRGLISVIISLFVFNGVFGQTQKTFVKSFPLNGDNFVVLNLDGDVEVKEWSEPFMRVHTNVELENASSQVLKLFLMQGRYRLTTGFQDGAKFIASTPRSANVKYKGQVLNETVTYTVFVPEYTEVQNANNEDETTVSHQKNAPIYNK